MKVFAITVVLLSLIVISGTVSEAVREADLVLYLPFDEGKGGTAKDLSEHQNDGTLHKAKWTKGKYGNAVELSGESGGWVEVPDAPSLDLTDEVTLMGWFYPTQFTNEWLRMIVKTWAGDTAPWMVSGFISRAAPTGRWVSSSP